MTLNPKQTRFVQEYMIDLNATQAAIRAGYSKATAQPQSSRLLSNVMIQQAIAEHQAEAAKKHEVTIESIAGELDLAYKAAAKFKQAGAMVAAAMGKARLYGMIVERKNIRVSPYEGLSDEQLIDRIQRLDAATRLFLDAPTESGASGGTGSETSH